jgi:hypothetical protein
MFRKKIKKRSWNLSLIILICFVLPINSGCQRDDICPVSTPTTPLLRISFFDVNERDVPKPPTNLRIKAADLEPILPDRVNVSEISIPLRPNANVTEYQFILNATGSPATGQDPPADNSNTDRILFSYTPEQVYINRACSYKVNYLNLTAIVQQDNNNWIRSITVQERNVENETSTHIFIYH